MDHIVGDDDFQIVFDRSTRPEQRADAIANFIRETEGLEFTEGDGGVWYMYDALQRRYDKDSIDQCDPNLPSISFQRMSDLYAVQRTRWDFGQPNVIEVFLKKGRVEHRNPYIVMRRMLESYIKDESSEVKAREWSRQMTIEQINYCHEYVPVAVSNRHDQFVLGAMDMIYVRTDSLSEYVNKLHHAYETYDASLGIIQLRDVEVNLYVLVVGDKRCVSTIMTFGCSDITWEGAPDVVRRSYNEVNE